MHAPTRPLLALVLLLTAGCGPLYSTSYDLTPPTSVEGRGCAAQCETARHACGRSCRMEERLCRIEARHDAIEDYHDYVRERTRKGREIKRSPESFDRGWSCNASACESDCGGQFRNCFAGCGGLVEERRVCVAFCDGAAMR
ncbi:hypothetical protein HL658_03180 [Azospirillum sp. RWY-5-1]|uniref:Uncharacterized protein n=1 Tax=Azospirillum oleiclasticum TaxID=2735135 RepID=A0ABX2T319_9PROT|nr:hypothetical protein [Azospirillum oleiclasticum]NYZ11540.1 hypothetical protein [Azospirillum oleiclasticum]NYZ18701.1 hypothetical protein [Azospirillum oleiclasticum]